MGARIIKMFTYPLSGMLCSAGGCGLWFALVGWFTARPAFFLGGPANGALFGGLYGVAFGGVFGALLGLAALVVRSRPQLIVVAGLVVGLLAAAVAMSSERISAPTVTGVGLVLLYTVIGVVMAAWVTRTRPHRGSRSGMSGRERLYHHRRPVGDLLDLAFGLLKRQVWVFLGVSALVAVPATAVLSLLSTLVLNLSLDQGWAGLLWWPLYQPLEYVLAEDPLLYPLSTQAPNLANLIEQVVVPSLALGALVHLAARAYREEPTCLGQAYRLGLPSALALLPVMGGLLLVQATFAAAVTSSFILVTRLDSRILGLLLGLVVPALFLGAIGWLNVGLTLAPYALVLERCGVSASFRRSWRLVEGSFWHTVAIILPVDLLVGLVMVAPTALSVVLARATGRFAGQQLTITLLSAASLMVALSLKSCVYTLLSIDLRMRAEGLDLAWRSRAAKETDA